LTAFADDFGGRGQKCSGFVYKRMFLQVQNEFIVHFSLDHGKLNLIYRKRLGWIDDVVKKRIEDLKRITIEKYNKKVMILHSLT